MKEIKPIEIYGNGMKKYDLSDFCEANFEEAQTILNYGYGITEYIDVESAYSKRIKNNFVGVYEITIERKADYDEFCGKLKYEKNHWERWFDKEDRKYLHMFIAGKIKNTEYWKIEEELKKEYEQKSRECTCKLCSFRLPTFEEWKEGYYSIDEKRKMKLGRVLKRTGFSQELIDFYSQQVKEEKTIFLTVSDLPQHIAGMSFYGCGWSSCQNPTGGSEESIHLAGSLYDNRLFVGMLHESLEDLENMKGKLLARTIFRLVTIDGEKVLIATKYYGTVKTKNELEYCLEKLESLKIFPNTVIDLNNGQLIKQHINGVYEMPVYDEIYIEENHEETVSITCPACNGTGKKEIWLEKWGVEYLTEISCPVCNGTGKYKTVIHVNFADYVEIESSIPITPYNEMYEIYNRRINEYHLEMKLDLNRIRQVLAKNKEKVIVE